MNWKQFYKLPLQLDPEPYCSYAWTKDDEMALGFDNDVTREEAQFIIDALNGKTSGTLPNLKLDGPVDFLQGDKYIFCVRGYGSLTGVGGHKLSRNKADKIQDEFVQYILKTLGDGKNGN